MAAGIVLAVVEKLYAALRSEELKEVCSMLGYESQLDELAVTVSIIKSVLLDAESKHQELSNEGRDYIERLKESVYDVEDLLDEFNTMVQKKKIKKGGNISKKGDALLWYDNLTFSRRMERKGRIRSWFRLEMKMRLKYLPCSTMDELWAELKTLKQNSLSVIEYAKLFEELHFVCDPEVSSSQTRIRFYLGLKSEIARRINLKMIHSFGELVELALCVERSLARLRKQEVLAETDSLEVIETVGKENGSDQGVVKPCLNLVHHESKYIEPESIEVLSYEEEDVSHVPLPTLEEEQANLNLVQIHEEEQKNDVVVQSLFLSTYMSPLDLYINKRLQKPLSLKMDQFLTSLDDKRCWSSSKNEQGECSYLVPNSKVLNLNPCTRPDTCFKTSCLGGIIVVKLGVEPPWPFGKRYMDSIEKKTGMGTNRGNESAHASSSNVQFSILVTELLSDVPMSPKQAIMVFDPGGRHVISVHEVKIALLIEGRKSRNVELK